MKYNYPKIRNKIYRIVRNACYNPNNKFAHTAWRYHVLSVREHSLKLGRMLGGDLEILELAALLHDYAGISNYSLYSKHHIHGARLAEKLLQQENYPQEKINHIKNCIFNHRGSVKSKRQTLEEKILASADAMSHITELADMFHLTFGVHKLGTEPGAKWLKKKLERSWAKIMPEGKKLIVKDWQIANIIINKALLREENLKGK